MLDSIAASKRLDQHSGRLCVAGPSDEDDQIISGSLVKWTT